MADVELLAAAPSGDPRRVASRAAPGLTFGAASSLALDLRRGSHADTAPMRS